MSGKKGRSGPPANLNAARHPWRSFWARRALKPEDKWLLGLLENYAAGLRSDKPEMSEAEKHVSEVAQTARGCVALIFAEVRRSGFLRQTDSGWDLQPGAKELARFLNLELSALKTLGLDRRTKDADLSIAEILSRRAAPAAQGDTNDDGNDSQHGAE